MRSLCITLTRHLSVTVVISIINIIIGFEQISCGSTKDLVIIR